MQNTGKSKRPRICLNQINAKLLKEDGKYCEIKKL